jgi:hypothetical protein
VPSIPQLPNYQLTKLPNSLDPIPSGGFFSAGHQLHFALGVFQRVALGTGQAQPEVFDTALGGGETKESSAIKTHQQLGALRVGTLRDHECCRCWWWFCAPCRCIFFDVVTAERVACNRKLLPKFSSSDQRLACWRDRCRAAGSVTHGTRVRHFSWPTLDSQSARIS